MERIMPGIFRVLYVSIFLMFVRRIIDKTRIMFDEDIPVHHEDEEGWYCVRLFRKYIIYDDMNRRTATALARYIIHKVPHLAGQVDLLELCDAECTYLADIDKLTRSDAQLIRDAYDECPEYD